MNGPHWDLGDLAVEAEMDAAKEAALPLGYFGRAPLQLADKNPAIDFRA